LEKGQTGRMRSKPLRPSQNVGGTGPLKIQENTGALVQLKSRTRRKTAADFERPSIFRVISKRLALVTIAAERPIRRASDR
ncbi:MAG TPA: hypothetical protein PK857_10410, partial [Hyphomicrobium sp.]|nr:hypothetical protein [Hyphomicrobium sp.]